MIDGVVHEREVGVPVLPIKIHALNVLLSVIRLLLVLSPLLNGAYARLHLSQLLQDFL